jgi:hypothetical protein
MYKMKLIISLCAVSFMLAACSTVTVDSAKDEALTASAPVTIHGSMYGFDWQNKKNVVLAKNASGRLVPLCRIECHTNYLYLLTGVLSLGLYYPQTFEYTLVKPETSDGENEESFNPFKKKLQKSGGK